MRENPRPFELYRHFKGGCYQVISIAKHSETGEAMVVYQQLYAPFEVYVRELSMFMSRVDRLKYPDASQEYRFEKITCDIITDETKNGSNGTDINKDTDRDNTRDNNTDISKETEKDNNKYTDKETELDPLVEEFLDASSYEKKLDVLYRLRSKITDDMINIMAVSIDTEVKPGEIGQRYQELRNSLIMLERFECNRLRQ